MSSDKCDPTGAEPATKIPAGLETLYALEKHNVKSSLGVLILSVHWSIIRAGLRVLIENSSTTSDKKYTERLPERWSDMDPNSQTPVFTYDYVDPSNPEVQYQVKVIEIVRDTTAVVTVYRHTESSTNAPDVSNKTSASTFQLQNFIQFDPEKTVQEDVRAEVIFYKAEELEKQIWTELMEPLGLKVIGLPPFQGPYDDKVKDKPKEPEKAQQQTQPLPLYRDDPLRDDRFIPRGPMGGGRPPVGPSGGFGPLFGPPMGGGGYGRSDLDPLGGIGAGMVADPRGFRQPRIGPGRLPPGAVPPGARFDPFGPPNPNPGSMPNWSVPNPDEPPPPGWDDMFM